MANADLLLYLAHGLFWSAFGATRVALRSRNSADAPAAATPERSGQAEEEAPYSRLVLGFHMVAFAVMYFGIGNAVIPHRVPVWFAGQRETGAIIIACGAALSCAATAPISNA